MPEQTLLEKIGSSIDQLLVGELPAEVSFDGNSPQEVREVCDRVNRLIRTFAEAREFLLALSEGRLEAEVPRRNFLVSPFKQLHANLRHLTWQTRQITRGDLDQHVDFLGEFSTSFNAMIASLRGKRVLEEELKRSQEALRRANEILEHQATTDPLTGIPNRLKFNSVLQREVSVARRHRVPLSLIILDIDHFKRVNDSYGHPVGDLVLQELASLVNNAVRSDDIFARWGGEEFVVLLSHTDKDGAGVLAERLRLLVEKTPFSVVQKVTCSFGISQFSDRDDLESFLQRADEALYIAKERGRNRVES